MWGLGETMRHVLAVGTFVLAVGRVAGCVEVGDVAGFVYTPGVLDPQCAERFLAEAPPALRKLNSELRGLEMRIHHRTSSTDSPGNPVERDERTWLLAVSEEADRKLAVDHDGIKYGVANERYSFEVSRANPEAPFVLVECEPWEQGTKQPMSGALTVCTTDLRSVVRIWWWPFSDIFDNDEFQLIAASCERGLEGKEAVTVAYRYQGPAKTGLTPNAIYWATLSPADSWAVIQSGVEKLSTQAETLRIRVTNELQRFGDIPVPRRHVLEYADMKSNRIVEVKVTEFGSPQPCRRPAEEFFLPHYGISESSVEILTPNRGLRIALVVIGVVGLAAAVMLFRKFGRGPAASRSR
ncbi:MAG: hypothetical protein DCC67_09635 [Planctomycetota bacterium]|nr:MAG: hypothetical protein DCC67_09635 [Planctomycetota bacterium]